MENKSINNQDKVINIIFSVFFVIIMLYFIYYIVNYTDKLDAYPQKSKLLMRQSPLRKIFVYKS